MCTDHGYTDILHNKYAPTFNKLASEYGLASPYWDQQIDKPTLLSQLDKAHKSWKEYVQDIPYAGYLGDCYPTVCQESDSLTSRRSSIRCRT